MEVHERDVVIVGAGLSGIGAAYRLMTECPDRSVAILEARERLGGTWDQFRYPGVRSDSDMFTLGYPFAPWQSDRAIASGPSILAYIRETAERFGIDRLIQFRHRIERARWSSEDARWTLDVRVGDELVRYRCQFLYMCSGYYSYDEAHAPTFEGAQDFAGRVVHPQWWPEDLDYKDKRVVVIGSGATAVTLVPSMAKDAAHVTMLQRSPTWILSQPERDVVARALRAVLPEKVAHRLVRGKNVASGLAFYQLCRRLPSVASRLLRAQAKHFLPKDFAMDPHFTPRYNPWEQRLCLVPDADLFKSIENGKASVVTDTIERFTKTGVRLGSGRELEADIVVTATGLKLLACGGVTIEVDGRAVSLQDTLVYKGLMMAGVPNFAWCVGYINASWTLRADLSSRFVCTLLNGMREHGYAMVVPHADDALRTDRPLLDLSSGYVQRAASVLPRQGTRTPWRVRQNYILDALQMKLAKLEDDELVFATSANAKWRAALGVEASPRRAAPATEMAALS